MYASCIAMHNSSLLLGLHANGDCQRIALHPSDRSYQSPTLLYRRCALGMQDRFGALRQLEPAPQRSTRVLCHAATRNRLHDIIRVHGHAATLRACITTASGKTQNNCYQITRYVSGSYGIEDVEGPRCSTASCSGMFQALI